jgi:L-methionine (R)-S-oxide reductase
MGDQARRDRYRRILDQISSLITATDDPMAHRATATAILHAKVPGVSWTGFYMLKDGELVVDAYQGPAACLVLEARIGVCWAAIDRRETVLVNDVHDFPGHIACDARARSEIVVPVFGSDGKPTGVLDVDSRREAHFDHIDREGYEAVIRMLEKYWNRH